MAGNELLNKYLIEWTYYDKGTEVVYAADEEEAKNYFFGHAMQGCLFSGHPVLPEIKNIVQDDEVR